MSITLARGAAALPKRTTVPRIQPSMDGGRPADIEILGFEGSFEGLVVEKDLKKNIAGTVVLQERALNHYVTIGRRISATKGPASRDDLRDMRRLESLLSRITAHLYSLVDRLDKAIPEEQRIVTTIDNELCAREATRKAARRLQAVK
jgi:hypothetical protein